MHDKHKAAHVKTSANSQYLYIPPRVNVSGLVDFVAKTVAGVVLHEHTHWEQERDLYQTGQKRLEDIERDRQQLESMAEAAQGKVDPGSVLNLEPDEQRTGTEVLPATSFLEAAKNRIPGLPSGVVAKDERLEEGTWGQYEIRQGGEASNVLLIDLQQIMGHFNTIIQEAVGEVEQPQEEEVGTPGENEVDTPIEQPVGQEDPTDAWKGRETVPSIPSVGARAAEVKSFAKAAEKALSSNNLDRQAMVRLEDNLTRLLSLYHRPKRFFCRLG
jgi:hypothetical protein